MLSDNKKVGGKNLFYRTHKIITLFIKSEYLSIHQNYSYAHVSVTSVKFLRSMSRTMD